MNYYKKFINDVFVEWRFQTDTGVPNINNPLHESLLRKILIEKNIDRNVIKQVIRSIREKDETFPAVNDKSGKVVYFQTKAARDAAIKKGTHTDTEKKQPSKKPVGVFDKQKQPSNDNETWQNFKDITVAKMKKSGMMDESGKINLPFGDRKLGIRMGKKTGGDYKQRLVDVLNNPTLQQPENAEQLESMLNQLEEFNKDTGNSGALQAALDAANKLNDTGAIDVSISELGNPPNNYISIRINNAPMYTFNPGDQTSVIKQAAAENGIAKRKGASDSAKWKPQAPGGAGLLPEDVKPAEEIGEALSRLGVGSRGQRYGKGQEAQNQIADTLQTVVDQERSKGSDTPFSEAELKAMEDYNNLLKDTNMSPDDKKQALKEQFLKLRQSSKEPNEVHKNFGEVHAAATLAIDFPDGELIFPMEGNAGFHDFCMVFGDESTGYNVVEFPVKAAGVSKGVGSSWKTIYKSFTFVETEEAQRAQENLNWLADTIGGMSTAAQDKLLIDENNEQTQRTNVALNEMWDTVDDNDKDEILRTLGIESWESLSTQDKYGWFVNKAILQEAMYGGAVEPHVDSEETAKRAKYCYVYDDGLVETRENKVSCYKFGSPKREKAIKGKPYKRGQVIHTFKKECPPIVKT